MRISDWSSDVCSSDLLSVVTALGGVFFGSVAVVGYLTRPLGAAARWLFALAGLGLLVPVDMLPGAALLNIVAAGLAGLLLLREIRAGRQAADRKSVVAGKSVSVRVALGCRRYIKKKKTSKIITRS